MRDGLRDQLGRLASSLPVSLQTVSVSLFKRDHESTGTGVHAVHLEGMSQPSHEVSGWERLWDIITESLTRTVHMLSLRFSLDVYTRDIIQHQSP
jgi:hypothetical protein